MPKKEGSGIEYWPRLATIIGFEDHPSELGTIRLAVLDNSAKAVTGNFDLQEGDQVRVGTISGGSLTLFLESLGSDDF